MTEILRMTDSAAMQWEAVVSHQLKTPLCAMQADLIRTRNVDPSRMLQDVQRMLRLVDQLHLAGRCRSGMVRVEPGCLAEAATAVCRRLVPLALDRGQRFCFRRFGGAGRPLPVMMDRVLAEEAICNLVENAIKYAPEDSVILVAVTEAGQIHVLDSGPGVAEADSARIFEPFQRGAATAHLQGSGLGLSLAATIMSMQRGTIKYRPRRHGGSAFSLRFRMPGQPALSQPTQRSSDSRLAPAPAFRRSVRAET